MTPKDGCVHIHVQEEAEKEVFSRLQGACLSTEPVRFDVLVVSPTAHALFMDYSFVYMELCFHSFNLLNSGRQYLAKVNQLVERG